MGFLTGSEFTQRINRFIKPNKNCQGNSRKEIAWKSDCSNLIVGVVSESLLPRPNASVSNSRNQHYRLCFAIDFCKNLVWGEVVLFDGNLHWGNCSDSHEGTKAQTIENWQLKIGIGALVSLWLNSYVLTPSASYG
jgi:hypothetical protein